MNERKHHYVVTIKISTSVPAPWTGAATWPDEDGHKGAPWNWFHDQIGQKGVSNYPTSSVHLLSVAVTDPELS